MAGSLSTTLYEDQVVKTAPLSFRVAPEVKAALERAAKDDHRSLSSLIEKFLIERLRKCGYLDATEKQPA